MTPNYVIRLTATDTGVPPASRTALISIRVKDVNDRPTLVYLISGGVEENSPGAVVGRLFTVDEDLGQTYSYIVQDSGRGLTNAGHS